MTGKDGNVSPVEERPTTYNRSFQIALIAAFVLVVIIMVYASLFRSAPRGQSVEKQVRQELQRQTPPGPEESFRSRSSIGSNACRSNGNWRNKGNRRQRGPRRRGTNTACRSC